MQLEEDAAIEYQQCLALLHLMLLPAPGALPRASQLLINVRLLAKLLRQVADTSVAHAGGSTADDHGVLKALKERKAAGPGPWVLDLVAS
ncbi:hypothetical protein HaLaN_28161 [Haematococcus lacustris]|uniref:Uncharacterized protein n=1 Tax=Haematococcus lacustris TaxID=44745 RepID=A0A6A0AB35_HAELA|nr:hypothetical protein HaLaN_28161 [Haematococcus lacustris]